KEHYYYIDMLALPSLILVASSSLQLWTCSTTSSPRMEKSKSGCSQKMLYIMVDKVMTLALSSSSLTSVALNSSIALRTASIVASFMRSGCSEIVFSSSLIFFSSFSFSNFSLARPSSSCCLSKSKAFFSSSQAFSESSNA
ncbi:hypothetical protein PanWU01x14_113900, partial [Parasponia andersonii]